MKTKDLIEQLQKLDPTGETEVVVGCRDIYFAEHYPMYYDGCPIILIRDESKLPYYNIIGFKSVSTGSKIVLHTMDLEDVIEGNSDCIVELDKYTKAHIGDVVEQLKKEYKEHLIEVKNG